MSKYEPEENESGEYEVDYKWADVMAGAAGPRAERPTADAIIDRLIDKPSIQASLKQAMADAAHMDTPPNRNQGPSHYTGLDIQPWEAMESWMTKDEFIGFLRGNIIKYLARAPHKGGVEDYRKAKHYLGKLLSLLAES